MTESGFAANSGTCHLCRGPGSAPPPVAGGAATADCVARALAASIQSDICLKQQKARDAVFNPAFVTYSGVQKSETTLKMETF